LFPPKDPTAFGAPPAHPLPGTPKSRGNAVHHPARPSRDRNATAPPAPPVVPQPGLNTNRAEAMSSATTGPQQEGMKPVPPQPAPAPSSQVSQGGRPPRPPPGSVLLGRTTARGPELWRQPCVPLPPGVDRNRRPRLLPRLAPPQQHPPFRLHRLASVAAPPDSARAAKIAPKRFASAAGPRFTSIVVQLLPVSPFQPAGICPRRQPRPHRTMLTIARSAV